MKLVVAKFLGLVAKKVFLVFFIGHCCTKMLSKIREPKVLTVSLMEL